MKSGGAPQSVQPTQKWRFNIKSGDATQVSSRVKKWQVEIKSGKTTNKLQTKMRFIGNSIFCVNFYVLLKTEHWSLCVHLDQSCIAVKKIENFASLLRLACSRSIEIRMLFCRHWSSFGPHLARNSIDQKINIFIYSLYLACFSVKSGLMLG